VVVEVVEEDRRLMKQIRLTSLSSIARTYIIMQNKLDMHGKA